MNMDLEMLMSRKKKVETSQGIIKKSSSKI